MLQYEDPNLIISSLQKQLRRYKEELQLWKLKYTVLQQQHNQLLQALHDKKIFKHLQNSFNQNNQNAFMTFNKKNSEQAALELLQQDHVGSPKINYMQSGKQQQSIIIEDQIKESPRQKVSQGNYVKNLSPFGLTSIAYKNQVDDFLSPERSPRLKQDDDNQVDFFSIEQIKKHTSCQQKLFDQTQHSQKTESLKKKGLDLIQGYFILEKIDNFRQNIKNHSLWIKNANQSLLSKQTNLLQIVYRYTFRQEPLVPMEDDPFDSRVNQIKYGTPYEELTYSFDNFQPNQDDGSKGIFKALRKKYVHCLIRPEITLIEGKTFETQIIYGFISPFPFRNFFQDLHRTVQQEIKFDIIKSHKIIPQQVQVSKEMRIQIVSKLMRTLFKSAQKTCANIQNFPIKLNLQTKVSVLKLQIQSQEAFRQMQRENLQILLKKYNLIKICKILHYVLTEKQIVLVSTNRKNLNEIFQIIRLMIKPFYWVFPIVYRYSDHFEPFLSSPLPLMIGIVFDFLNKNYKENKILMSNQFVTIFVDQTAHTQKETFFFFSSKSKYSPNDLRQLAIYEKDINSLYKYLSKNDKKSTSNQSQRIHKYISRLKRLVQTGSLDTELSTFMIDFLDTQMVQSFKDLLNGSNKKLYDYTEDATMTK